tara:strand:+ start:549 stop:932 length:384 start_codon:yes stop_codon:yes gene_type:complete
MDRAPVVLMMADVSKPTMKRHVMEIISEEVEHALALKEMKKLVKTDIIIVSQELQIKRNAPYCRNTSSMSLMRAIIVLGHLFRLQDLIVVQREIAVIEDQQDVQHGWIVKELVTGKVMMMMILLAAV